MGRVVSIAVVVGLKLIRKGSDSKQIKEDAFELIQNLPSYSNSEIEKKYITKIFDANYQPAFDKAYELGGRRQSNTFDQWEFFDQLLSLMHDKAKKDKRTQIATELREMQSKLSRLKRISEDK